MKDKKERITLRRVVWRGGKAGIPRRNNNVCGGTEEGKHYVSSPASCMVSQDHEVEEAGNSLNEVGGP